MKKIIVIGCPGCGKSTFAKELHNITGIPLFHLDRMYWNADKTVVDGEIFQERLMSAIQEDKWIIDGNYGASIELRLQECDTVFFLDYPLEVCLEGVQTRKGKVRSDISWTEPDEEDDVEFIEFIRKYREVSRPVVMELLDKYAERNIYIFKNRDEGNAYLSNLYN